jgi:serine phosphatase RsbU (regulator of sigma subunit)
MSASDDPGPLDLRGLLARVEAAPPSSAAQAFALELADHLGAADVGFWIADYSGRVVVRTDARPGVDRAEHQAGRLPLDDGVHGRVLRTQEVHVSEVETGHLVLAPVTNRGDSVGLLEMVLGEPPDDEIVGYIAAAAHAMAFVVAANRQFTDLYEWGMRTTRFSLASEIQRRLLPSAFSCEIGPATVAGWIEPAHDIGGDTFDFSADDQSLHLSVTDAMGHDLEGAMLATLAVGALRNARRRELSLVEQAAMTNDALVRHADSHQFVTGQLVRIDLDSGAAHIVNAGHPPPYRVRDGRVEALNLEVDLPFGLATEPYRAQTLDLRPGDRLVLVSDGMLERDAGRIDLLGVILDMCDEHPREAVHGLSGAVVAGLGGELRDDAMVMCVDWYGHEQVDRSAPTGASADRSSH